MSNRSHGNNKEVILERRKKAWELRIKYNMTMDQIAEQLGCDSSTISKDLRKLNKAYHDQYLAEIHPIKIDQVAQLELVAQEALIAWEKSKGKKSIITETRGYNGITTSTETKDSEGDPIYLATYMKAKQQIREILGIDAALKIDGKLSVSGELATTRTGVMARLLKHVTEDSSGTST